MKTASLLLLFFITGCSHWNPFVPNGNVPDYQTTTSSQPVTSKAMYRATMKPYRVKGVKYYPIIPKVGDTFVGTASWYGPNFHGGKTSNGEYYNMHDLTAAHKTLPMNTLLEVTNLSNGLSTIVRINDRGPFVNDRIIDLSYQAAQDIEMIKKGTAKVRLKVIDYDVTADNYKRYAPFKKATNDIKKVKNNKKELSKIEKNVKKQIYQIQLLSSKNRLKAQKAVEKYAKIDDKYSTKLKSKIVSGKTLYCVVIGDFQDKKVAKSFMLNNGLIGAFVIKD